MAGKSILSSTLFSQKKLVAKGHTAANKTDFSEGLSSAVQVGASFIFADNVPTTPDTNWNTQQYKLQGNVQMVEFDVEAVPGTNYRSSDVDTIGVQTGRIDSQNIVGTHGYRLKLKADYEQKTQEANGNNTIAGNGSHVNGKVLADSFGALQLVPVNFGTYNIAGISVYNVQFFSGPDDINDQIGSSDEIDYIVDYYSGLIFVQDVKVGYPTPVRARGFIYTGRMLSERLTTVETGNDVGWLGPASGFISTTGSLGIGTSTGVVNDAEALIGNLGSAIFNNQNRPGSDFVVNSADKSAIKVDSDINQVLILSGGNENSIDEASGTDVAFFVSGSKNSRGTATRGTAVFGGDVVVSGSLFDIDGNVIGGSAGIVQDSDGDTKIQVEESVDEDKIRFDTAGTERMIIDGDGKVGIGTDSPSHRLDVNGDIRLRGNDIRDNSGNPAISMDGSANTTIVNNGVVGGTLAVGKSDLIAGSQLDVAGKINFDSLGFGAAFAFGGVAKYAIRELNDTLWRADLRAADNLAAVGDDGQKIYYPLNVHGETTPVVTTSSSVISFNNSQSTNSGIAIGTGGASEDEFIAETDWMEMPNAVDNNGGIVAKPTRTDLPRQLFDGFFSNRLDLKHSRTHTFVINMRTFKDFPTGGLSYSQGNVYVGFFTSHVNFKSIKVEGFHLQFAIDGAVDANGNQPNFNNTGRWVQKGDTVTSINDDRNISRIPGQALFEFRMPSANHQARDVVDQRTGLVMQNGAGAAKQLDYYLCAIRVTIEAGDLNLAEGQTEEQYYQSLNPPGNIPESDRCGITDIAAFFDRRQGGIPTSFFNKFDEFTVLPGGISYGNGSASSPTVTFNEKQNSGLYFRSSDNSLNIVSDGKEAITFDSTGTGVYVLSGSGAELSPDESSYTDVNFFVSGSIGSKGSATKGSSLFGGDVITSGSITSHKRLTLNNFDNSNSATLESYDANGSLIISSSNGDIKLDAGSGVWRFDEDGVEQLRLETLPDANDIKFLSTNSTGGAGQIYFNIHDGSSEIHALQLGMASNANGNYGRVGINFQSGGPTNLLDIKTNDINDQGFTVRNASNKRLITFSQEGLDYGRLIFFDENSLGQTQISTRPAVHTYFTTASYKGTDELGNETTTAASRFGIGTRTPESLFDVRGDGQDSQILLLSGAMDANASNPTAYTDTSFFLSGSINSKNSATIKGTSVIGGDLVISGASHYEAISEAPTNPSAGSIAMYAKDVNGSAKLFIKDSSGTELSIGSSNWEDGGDFVFPADNDGAESVVIGANNTNDADIILGADGSAEFNKQQQNSNFVISSANKSEAFKVTSDSDLVNVKSSTTTVTADTKVRLELTVASNQQGGGNQGGGGQSAVASTGTIQVLKAGESTSNEASSGIVSNPDNSGDYTHFSESGTILSLDDGLGTVYSKLEIEINQDEPSYNRTHSNSLHYKRESDTSIPTMMVIPGTQNIDNNPGRISKPCILLEANTDTNYRNSSAAAPLNGDRPAWPEIYCRGQEYALTANFTDRKGNVLTIDFVTDDLDPVFAEAKSVLNMPSLRGQSGGFRRNTGFTNVQNATNSAFSYSVGVMPAGTNVVQIAKAINYNIACCLLDCKERDGFAIEGVSYTNGSGTPPNGEPDHARVFVGKFGFITNENRGLGTASPFNDSQQSTIGNFTQIQIHSDQFAGGTFNGVDQAGAPLSFHISPHSSAIQQNWTQIPNPIIDQPSTSGVDDNAPFRIDVGTSVNSTSAGRIRSRRSNKIYYPFQYGAMFSNNNTTAFNALGEGISYAEFAVYLKNIINNHKIDMTAEIDPNNSSALKISCNNLGAQIQSNAPADISITNFTGTSTSGFTPASFPRFTIGDGSISETFVIDGDANKLLLVNGGDASTFDGSNGLPMEDSQRGRIVIPTTTSSDVNALLTIYPTDAATFHTAHKTSSMINGSDVVSASSILNMKLTDQDSKSVIIAFGSTSAADITNIEDELDEVVIYGDVETIYRVYQSKSETSSFYIHVDSSSAASNNENGLAHAIYACVRHANSDNLIDIDAELMAKSLGTKSQPALSNSNPAAQVDIVVLTVQTAGFSGNSSSLVFSDPGGIMTSVNDGRLRSISYGYNEAFDSGQTSLRNLDRHTSPQSTATNNQYLGTSMGNKIYFRQGGITGSGAGISLTKEQIATAVSEVINGSALSLSASANGDTVNLTDSDGFNVQITSSNSDGLLTISGMSGGTQASSGGGGGGGGGNNQVHSVELTSTGFQINTNLLPSTDKGFSLGSPNRRFSDIYTGDLHLRNERGDWTVIEEPDFLTITNNKTGKRFKLLMEPFE